VVSQVAVEPAPSHRACELDHGSILSAAPAERTDLPLIVKLGTAELSALGLWRHPRSPDDKLASTRLWPQPLPAMISVWQQDG
jgi:hypothetical protein